MKDEECGTVIDNGWKSLPNVTTMVKLRRVVDELRCWGRVKFGKV